MCFKISKFYCEFSLHCLSQVTKVQDILKHLGLNDYQRSVMNEERVNGLAAIYSLFTVICVAALISLSKFSATDRRLNLQYYDTKNKVMPRL